MKATVTGASGHLGYNLVRHLISQGDEVCAVLRRDHPQLKALGTVRFVSADMRDPASLSAAFEGADVVYHLAGQVSIARDRGGAMHETNVKGTSHAARAALGAGVSRFVHCSSATALDFARCDKDGIKKGELPELDESFPLVNSKSKVSDYEVSKADSERALRGPTEEGLHTVTVNPSGVIGPNDFVPSKMGRVFLDLKARKMPMLTSGAFDFVDVRDVAAGMRQAALKGRKGERYLLGGQTLSLAELAALASKATGVPAPRMTCPNWLAQASAPIFEGISRVTGKEALYTRTSLEMLNRGRKLSHDKAKVELGFTARPLDESISDIYQSFSQGGL